MGISKAVFYLEYSAIWHSALHLKEMGIGVGYGITFTAEWNGMDCGIP
jgi:hypothetical protein